MNKRIIRKLRKIAREQVIVDYDRVQGSIHSWPIWTRFKIALGMFFKVNVRPK